MKISVKFKFLLVMLFSLAVSVGVYAQIAPPISSEGKQIYQFGVFAYKGVERTQEEFAPVIEAVNQKLKNEYLNLQILSQDEIYLGLQNNTLDFVTTNPTHFLVARNQFEVTGALATLMKNHEGQPIHALAGVIIAHASNQRVNNLQDVKNKTISVPGLEYMGGYRAQAFELHLAGISLKNEQVHISGSHQATIQDVLLGRAAVGFIRDGIVEGMIARGLLDPNQIKVINVQYRPDFPNLISTRLYPEWPVFALPHVSSHAKRHITAAMLDLDFEEINLPTNPLYGFTVPSDYLGVEDLSRALRIPPFEKREEITLNDLIEQHGDLLIFTLLFAIALFITIIALVVIVKRARASELYSRQLLATQDELVLVNDGKELVDVSGGFLRFFKGYYATLDAFKQDYRCICDLFIQREGYLFNYKSMQWLERMIGMPNQQHKAIVNFQGQHTYFKCSAVYSSQLKLYLITMVDITELELANAQLAEQTRIAQQANQTKSNFLANMSHEIRTPMNGILGLSELGMKELDPAKLHHRLQKIHYSGTQLLGIINDILDLSKIEAGRLDLNPQAFSLHQLQQELLELYQPKAEEKGIKIKIELDANLALGYYGDDLRLLQVLTNLIGNAIKFTEQGVVTLRILLDHPSSNDEVWLRFEVQDTGKGISLEQQQRLFKPFSQADDSITRQFGGTGLGLTISNKLVNLMGGAPIRLQSELGQGSLFNFRLPFVQLDEAGIKQLLQNLTANKSIEQGQVQFNAHVLLVEDNEINQEVAGDQLKQLGIHFDLAANGEVAVSKAKETQYDLILMDIQMPVLDGYHATQAIRQFNSTVPIIALTAAAMIEDKKKAIESGMNDHLSKPINKHELIASLQKWMVNQQTNPSWVLIVHPDANQLKTLAKAYSQSGRVTVANNIEKATELLSQPNNFTALIIAEVWQAQVNNWQQPFTLQVQVV
jgi:signal transduction histidine kinase/DNA-binding NarL/FixJ family response regulator/ABC-type phosphate/phosphonate transport system substrate-binding protein